MATGIREKEKDRMPTRRPMVSRTPGGRFITDVSRNFATGVAEGMKSTVTDYRNAINAVNNNAKPVANPLQRTGTLARPDMLPKEDQVFKGARKVGDAIRAVPGKLADVSGKLADHREQLRNYEPPITYQNPLDRAAQFLQGAAGKVGSAVSNFLNLPYHMKKWQGGPQAPKTASPAVDSPLAAAPEQTKGPTTGPLTKRAEAASTDPKKWTPDFEKPLWWLDDRIPTDRKPIHAIRGTQQSWWSPNTGLEYASPREAYEGMTEEQRISIESKTAENLQAQKIEHIKGQYGVDKAKLYAQDNMRGRFKEYEQFMGEEGQKPALYDTWTGQPAGDNASEVASQLQAQTELFASMPEERAAQLLMQLSESEATQVLRGLQASRAQKILDIMDNLKPTPQKKE